ncbi:hypothetical protein PUNSTDRAFT_65748, partial [Punctularia strigosozonata HHB-11173 SS5]|uniref:uncharacterized protein n=1 Tax=Punctularia strigosozonata (strain HHB-11173) TaxID=741275 RepID=UPI0004416FF7
IQSEQNLRQTRAALSQLAEIAAKYDTDGVDVYFLNSSQSGSGLKKKADVKRLFDGVVPFGVTPIGEKLEELLLRYLSHLERAKDQYEMGDVHALDSIKPINYIILTDGAPTDDPEAVIVSAARRLDARHFPLTQIGVQFVQIGDHPEAAAFLQELDDDLQRNHTIRDMVDTTPYAGQLNVETLTKILLGGINRRVDRRGGGSVLY